MSGNGQAPFRSTWFLPPRTLLSPNMAMFYQRIGPNSNTNANTIWGTWFFGASTSTVTLLANTLLAAGLRSTATGVAPIAARVTSTVTASITKSTGRVALASRTAIEVFGRLTQPGALQLLGAAFVKVFSRLSAPTGRSSLQGQMILSVKPTAAATFSQRLFGYSRIAFTSAVNIFGAANLSGRSRAQASGRTGLSRLVLMAAIVGVAVRSQLSAATGKASLAGATKFVASTRTNITAVLPLVGILGATLIKATITGILYAFDIPPNSRITTPPREVRTVIAPPNT